MQRGEARAAPGADPSGSGHTNQSIILWIAAYHKENLVRMPIFFSGNFSFLLLY